MIKFENTQVVGFESAIRGMRNPMNSWDKSDSDQGCNKYKKEYEVCKYCDSFNNEYEHGLCKPMKFVIGENDLDLMKKLRTAGTDHRKYLRMINVYVDITAPLYWWKEFDTYKVGTVANSCSTMHKIQGKEFTLDDFSHEHLDEDNLDYLGETCLRLNYYREKFNGCAVSKFVTSEECKQKKKDYWWQIIQLLPSSYNQKRTVILNYEVLNNMYQARKSHKLDEWRVGFIDWINTLPYTKELITGEE